MIISVKKGLHLNAKGMGRFSIFSKCLHLYPMKIESYSWKHRLAKLSFHLQKARRSKCGDNIQSKTSLNEIISLKEKTTPFPTNTTFKSNKKHTPCKCYQYL